MSPDPDDAITAVDLHTDRAHTARIYDYVIGGKDNFAADREAAERTLAAAPFLRTSMRANRACMQRIIRHLAAEHGISQFLDIGTGIPTSPNVHEVAQAVDPATRVVYMDNDPIVLAHARALLRSAPQGRTAYIDGDLREPEAALADPALTGTLDLDRPIALTIIAVLQFVPDEEAVPLLRRYMDALPSGSFLALTIRTADTDPDGAARVTAGYGDAGIHSITRTRAEAEALFKAAGTELVAPGIQLTCRWLPDEAASRLTETQVSMYAGVARKP
ncbi:methyltransferase [Mangrovactinospora gilvigrisea]|uniref:Methyltransferase n=2 Tax=Mangrovactinospora gilvigrisea TaxID=1428644 RepID=A0A1J7BCE1_9ACTN|nr:SAM-dependent methyltransferase [Mangrovactinospora gilvigrisea]OIV36339.1 methyltransferase [Mangrovactinospora gilvigrisea]